MRQGSTDPVLKELLEALLRADTTTLALSAADEVTARATREAFRQLIRDRIQQLIPLATEPTAGLICYLLGVTSERITINGAFVWKLSSLPEDSQSKHYMGSADAYQAAVLMRFPRKEWEAKVDRGVLGVGFGSSARFHR